MWVSASSKQFDNNNRSTFEIVRSSSVLIAKLMYYRMSVVYLPTDSWDRIFSNIVLKDLKSGLLLGDLHQHASIIE